MDKQKEFVKDVKSHLQQMQTEIEDRNSYISERDTFIYGEELQRRLDIPVGHDQTPVNWLRRAVEIHRDQFMGRGFTLVSTYDSADIDSARDKEDQERILIENKQRKARAEARRQLTDAIQRDNGGSSFWKDLAENAGAVGFSVVKTWYDEDEEKFNISPIESVENFYAVWSQNNFREADAYAYVYQVSETTARERFDLSGEKKLQKSPMGQPLNTISPNANVATDYSQQEMVTVMEVTGKIPGWGSDKGKIKKVKPGKENNINALIVSNTLQRVIDDEKKLPRYYILPNKRQRKRPWGVSDISDTAIHVNLTYIETLSDWRTVANRVNFPKWKMFGFDPNAELPTFKQRKIQGIGLEEGQDIQLLQQGDSNQVDFNAQLEKEKEDFLREVGVSRVLWEDPSITLNSNQALMTAMKATTDIAEAKKALWTPVITQMFKDALEIVGEHRDEVKELIDDDEDWHFKVQWPSTMQKEDPMFQQMLLNRFNSNTISLQTFLEMQGETKEEIDRIRDEMEDQLTASILGRTLGQYSLTKFAPADDGKPKTNISLRGDLTPYQEANLASQLGFNQGPFPATAGPQGSQGNIAEENADNAGFINGNPFQGGTPIQRGPDGQPVEDQRKQVATQAENQEGQGPVSQPGSGAPSVSAQGAINQQNQNEGA